MRKFLLLTAIALLACGVAACSSSSSHHTAAPERTAHSGTPTVIDVRTPEEFASGHVPGAINIPVSQIETRIKEVAKAKDAPLMVHCQVGGRSARATSKLRQMGYTNIKDLGSFDNAKATLEGSN